MSARRLLWGSLLLLPLATTPLVARANGAHRETVERIEQKREAYRDARHEEGQIKIPPSPFHGARDGHRGFNPGFWSIPIRYTDWLERRKGGHQLELLQAEAKKRGTAEFTLTREQIKNLRIGLARMNRTARDYLLPYLPEALT